MTSAFCFKLLKLPLLALTVTLGLTSCNGSGSDDSETASSKVSKGVITYQISYPGLDNSNNIMVAGLPKHMSLVYKGNKYKTEVHQKLLKFKTILISDSDKKQLTAILQYGKKQYYAIMNEKEVDEFLHKFPKVDYLGESLTDSILGLETFRQLALFDNISDEINLRYTRDIKIKDANWCNPFKEIDGMLLNYGVEFYGVAMSFKAEEIEINGDVNDDDFNIPEGYEEVPYSKIDMEITELFKMVQ